MMMRTDQHAYRLAPWRKQAQFILNILVILILVAAVIMVYLSISAELTAVKLETQVLHEERSNLLRTIADTITQEGRLTSYTTMEKKAAELGYIDVDLDDEDIFDYVILDGYSGEKTLEFRSSHQQENMSVGIIKPEYTQSLQQRIEEIIAAGKENE